MNLLLMVIKFIKNLILQGAHVSVIARNKVNMQKKFNIIHEVINC